MCTLITSNIRHIVTKKKTPLQNERFSALGLGLVGDKKAKAILDTFVVLSNFKLA